MKKTVWLEVSHILKPNYNAAGVGYYTSRLIETLAKGKNRYEYTLIGSLLKKYPLPPVLRYSLQSKLLAWIPPRFFRLLLKLRLVPPVQWLYRGRPDIVVFFDFVRFPMLSSAKSITVIHDLAFKIFPDTIEVRNRWYLNKFVQNSAHKSTVLIAVSQSTKEDIVKYLGISDEKICIVPPAVDGGVYKNKRLPDTRKSFYGLKKPYFLYIGTLEPRKNIAGIIDAYRFTSTDIQKQYDLVLAGKKGWQYDSIKNAIEGYDGPGRIITPGYIEQQDVAGLMGGAYMFIFPSLYEGFGMPVLEAMAAGVPVVTSNTSSLPEVVGDAALMVQPDDIQKIANAITKICTDQPLRSSLIKRGYKQAELFSWERSAKKFEAAIDLALSRPNQ